MAETRRSSAAAAVGKRPSPSPYSSSVPPPKRPKAESPGSPTASAPGRAEEDSVVGAAPARSAGSAEDAAAAAAVAQKDQGADKPSSAAAKSSKRGKEPEQRQPAAPWAMLLSQCSQTPHHPISAAQFSVGQSKSCNLWLKDQPISKVLCKLRRLEQGGSCELEVLGKKGMVQLNGRSISPCTKVPLTGGDEVIFSSCDNHAYIFQHPLNDKVLKTVPSSAVSLLEPPVASVKHIHTDKRTGDTSAVAGAEMLASTSSNQTKDVAAAPPVAAGENSQRVVRPIASSASDKSKGRAVSPDKEFENGENANEVNSNIEDSPMDVAAAPISLDDAANDTYQQNGFGPDTHLGGEIAFEDQRDLIRDLNASTSVPPSRCQAFKDGMKQGIINPSDIDVTFENFPYYLSDNTKNMLLSCAFIHLEKKEFIKRFAEISSINQRILLSGPVGSEIYQETLVKALAKHFGARLLVVDSLMLPGAPSKVPESQKDFAIYQKHRSLMADKSYTFREGDRVRYVGPAQPSFLSQRGPSYGYRGRVMLAFEDNASSKIGVRYDKQIPDGNDLGGLCEEGHGFFSSDELLRPDFSAGEEVERLAMTELIEVISEENKSGPLIVLLKDVVKSFTGITESLSSLRSKLELLPSGVLVIGSHTQMDSRKEKTHPGGFLFTEYASGSQTLFDPFPDSFGSRLHERSKESAKTVKHLNKLFPNKISIQLPQDEALLTYWKQQLDRDVETLKAKSNIGSISTCLSRYGIECNDLEELFIKDQELSNETVDKVVGYAVCYHLKHNKIETPNSKDAKLVLTSESLKHGLNMLQSIQSDNESSKKSLKAEAPGSPMASVPGRAEVDSVAGAAPARSVGSAEDAAAVSQKDQGADKPSSAAAESSKTRKEPEQQQPAEHGRSCFRSAHRMENMHMEFDSLESILGGSESPRHLKLPFLQFITKNFSDDLKIGSGGCGVVYKGILRNQIIAVKRLLNSHTIEDKMFHREVTRMMMVNHKNVVRFLGYCSHTEEQVLKMGGKLIMAENRERLLCFEYLINGSLESYLTDELRGLEWQTRYQIIKGICDGLHHLHSENHIIHMDLKPANILLDSNMVPKIIDFGLSRLDNISQTMCLKRLGTLGYCAPEYLHYGKMSAKSDIYSLGVIILVLVTGSKEEPNITKVHRRWKHRWNKAAKDAQLGYKQVATCLHLMGRCMQIDPTDRPNICDIISCLNEMDSRDAETRDGTKCIELEDMLGIEPLEIHLPFEPNKQISCSVELTNDTDDYFAFRISTNSLRPYCIQANQDIVLPRSKCSVTISMQALDMAHQGHQCRDEFSVKSTRVDGGPVAMNILSGDIFNEEAGKVIDTVNFSVVLSETVVSPSPDH